MTELRPPLPPFTPDTANQKVRAAEDAWNSRDPSIISRAYSLDSKWRHRTEFLQGRAQIEAFLTNKWTRENEYRLVKELWGFRENRIAVRFAYEWRDHGGQWYRSYGNENWEFDEQGLMRIVSPASMTRRSRPTLESFSGMRRARARLITRV